MKHFLKWLLPLLILAGCTAPAAPASTTESAATAEVAGEVETRVVQHAMGESVVPANPQRVVVLDIGELDAALALGIQPVGSVTIFDDGLFPAYLQDRTEGIEVVGTIGSPDLEKILALEPDLILSNKSRDEAIYPLLSEIAPTVFAEQLGPVWKDNFQLYAEALGKEAEGAEVVAAYEARVAQLGEALGDAGNLSVSIVRFIEGGTTRIYHRGSFIGSILDDIGFARPSAQQVEDTVWTEVSKELIPELDADVIFYGIYGAAEDSPEADYLNDLLWAQLSAVQAGQVFAVDDGYWFVGLGYNAANRVLDDIFAHLAPDAVQAEEAASSGESRTVVHAMGETVVPATPQRVVVLDTGELDNTLALGVTPVGAPLADALTYQEYLADQLEGVGDTGTISEPNLEAILALKPDLILGSKQRYEAIYEQLSQIAPTVFTESLRVPWQDTFRLHAEALGKSAEAEQLLAEYDAHIAEVQAVLGDQLGSTTVSIIRFRPGQVRLYLKSSFIGYILQDVGIARPPSQDVDEFSSEITLEQIADVDADYVFITGYATEDSDLETFLESPLWLTLGAVQAGRALDVDDDTWISGLGIQAANHVLDDLVTYLTQE